MKFLSFVFLTGLTILNQSLATPAKKKFICNKEGRFADNSDCTSFFECVSNADRSLTSYKRSCHGKAFNPKTRSCTNPAKVKGCKIREGRLYAASTRFSRLCKSKINEFACGDCATQVTCSDGIAYETQCESNLRCVEGLNGFSGGVCHLKYKDQCRCKEPNTYYQDPYYNGTFFLCREKDSVPMFYNCPSDMYFNTTTKTCLSRDGTPACAKKGLFVYPNDCSRYYMCTYAVEGWVQSRLKCPSGLLFNEETEVCENPCEWSHKDFKCEEEGRFRNPKDCSQYFECILDLNGEFLKMMRSCPPDHHWNEDKKGCVYHLQSICKIQSEGPIKQCRKDYKQICQKQELPQIEEKPTTVTNAPINNENNNEQSTVTTITTKSPGESTESVTSSSTEDKTQIETTTENKNNVDNSGDNVSESPDEGHSEQENSNQEEDDNQNKTESTSESSTISEKPKTESTTSDIPISRPTESMSSSSTSFDITSAGTTEEPSQPESTSKESVVTEEQSKPEISITTTKYIEEQNFPTTTDQPSENSEKEVTKPEIINKPKENSTEEISLQNTTELVEIIVHESTENILDSGNMNNETTEKPQIIILTTEESSANEPEINPESEKEKEEETATLTGAEFQFSNVGIRPLPFPLTPQKNQIPVAIELIKPRT